MRTASQANKTVIISGSMATPNGLMFIVGQITWTTGSDNFIAMTPEEAWIQSETTTASPTSATAPTMVDTAPTTVDTAPTTVDTAPTTVGTAPTTVGTAPTTMDAAPTMMDLAPTMVHLAPTTPASPSATPTTRHPLPRYKGIQIDNTDLLDSIDQVDTKLAKTLALVSSIQSQPNKQVTATHNRST